MIRLATSRWRCAGCADRPTTACHLRRLRGAGGLRAKGGSAAQGRRSAYSTTTPARKRDVQPIGQALRARRCWTSSAPSAWRMKYMIRPKATVNYPFERNPQSPALPRRARAAPLSQRRGALHRLQAVRGHLPGPGHHHRGRAARRRQPPHDPLRHRHGQVHLLRPVPGGLPGGRHRRGPELRVRRSRPARSSTTTRSDCSRTATAGSGEIAKNLELDAPYR